MDRERPLLPWILIKNRPYNLALLSRYEIVYSTAQDSESGIPVGTGVYRLSFIGTEKPVQLTEEQSEAFGRLFGEGKLLALYDLDQGGEMVVATEE